MGRSWDIKEEKTRKAASRSKSKQLVAAKQFEKPALGAEIVVADG